jgi:ATP-dependent DNA helicase RecQ
MISAPNISSWPCWRRAFAALPRLALTATADPQTRDDLRRRLALEDAPVFATSFDRPNISYTIVDRVKPRRQLLDFLARHRGDTGIIYCLSRKKVEDTAAWLNAQGIRALPYHAGMDRAQRDANQDAFLREENLALVATIAFGMGIDQPSVRYVAHLDLPGSVEAYYQETGRAGRDGLPSDAWMTYGMSDLVRRRQMIAEGDAPEEVKRIERGKLSALLGICETAGCRRQAILAHFGETHAGGCGNCDTCLSPVETWDGTQAAQKVLSAIYRTGERYGAGYVIEVLRGIASDKVKRAGHDRIKTFGVGADMDEAAWQSVIRQLAAIGAIVTDHDAYGALTLGEAARPILKAERRLALRKDRIFKAERVTPKSTRATAAALLDTPRAEGIRGAARRADADRPRAGRAALCGVPRHHITRDGHAAPPRHERACRRAGGRPGQTAALRGGLSGRRRAGRGVRAGGAGRNRHQSYDRRVNLHQGPDSAFDPAGPPFD